MREFVCDELELYVVLEKQVCEKIDFIIEADFTNETGGIIIGYYTTSLKKAVITEFTDAPVDSKAGRRWFYRGVVGLKNLLIERWNKRNEFYLGEWHLHPQSNPTPSRDDINQMKKNAMDSRYKCPEPLLIIIGGTKNNPLLTVTMLYQGKEYRLRESNNRKRD